jgi:hypothetical protein
LDGAKITEKIHEPDQKQFILWKAAEYGFENPILSSSRHPEQAVIAREAKPLSQKGLDEAKQSRDCRPPRLARGFGSLVARNDDHYPYPCTFALSHANRTSREKRRFRP